jgi:hypothetical protein
LPRRFFHPGQFHLEPANLLKQFGFTRRLRLLFTHLLPTKEAAATVEQLLLPLGDLGRMHLVFTGKLAERLLLFGCFEGEAELELSTPMLAFLGHTPSTIRYKYFTASHLSCGLVSGDNYNYNNYRSIGCIPCILSIPDNHGVPAAHRHIGRRGKVRHAPRLGLATPV